MANKRIELEQYKSYMDLIDERPTAKTVREGKIAVFVICFIFLTLLVVLAFLSQEPAKNPSNVLEKPQETMEAPGGQTESLPEGLPEGSMPIPESGTEMPMMPQGTEIPGMPQGVSPETIPLPETMPESPGEGEPQSRATDDWFAMSTSADFLHTAIVQTEEEAAEPPFETAPIQVEDAGVQGEVPEELPETQDEVADEGPGQETTGIANLSKLADAIGGKGLPLYVIVISVVLSVLAYMGLRKVRRG